MNKSVVDNLVSLVLAGSRGRGLHPDEQSDFDWRGVFIMNPRNDFGLNNQNPDTEKGVGEDTVYWSLRHLFLQLAKGSPEAHELLWLKPAQTSDLWDELVSYRKPLLSLEVSQRLVSAVGWFTPEEAEAYLNDETPLKKGSRFLNAMATDDHKTVADGLRRMMVAHHVVRYGNFKVRYSSYERNLYLDARAGKASKKELLSVRNDLMDSYRKAEERNTKTLPDKTNTELLDHLLRTWNDMKLLDQTPERFKLRHP